MKKENLLKLGFSIILPFLASGIGSFFTARAIPGWYNTLVKPSFNPPNWIFGPVWSILYLLMGISLFIVWSAKVKNKVPAYWAFGIQLFLNALWSVLFFGMNLPLAAFVGIIFLWFSIAVTIVLFFRISRKAAYLLLPYIFWVSFAALLNLMIVILN